MPEPPRHTNVQWRRFSPLQLAVMSAACVPLLIIAGTVLARAGGFISTHHMLDVALGAGENPGTVVFGAMFFCTPVQWLTGRSQVRVRKFLGIAFFLLACSNGAMFIIERGIGGALGAPFLVAGTIALAVAVPLFLTSSYWSQRTLGMRRWRLLHRLTYVVAVALVAHILLIPDIGPGTALIIAGFVARIPAVRRWLSDRRDRPAPSAHWFQRKRWSPPPPVTSDRLAS